MTNYQIRADVFPATVHLTDPETGEETVLEKTRVILTLDHIFIYQDDNPAPKIVFEDRLNSYTPPIPATRVRKPAELLKRYAEFETESANGKFQRASGCGCGSRLKNASLASLMPNGGIAQAASTRDS